MNPWLFGPGAAAAALLLGAGGYARFAATTEIPYATTLLAAGAGLFGIVTWLATSGDLMVRVGDAGVAVDRETLQRIPWHQVESVRWDEKRRGVLVVGKDEAQGDLEISAPVATHPLAAAWIVKEADARIPKRVKLSSAAREEIGETTDKDGEVLPLAALQVVGKKCAKSRRAIAYAKDARVCPRCERIYHRKTVPDACACGNNLSDLVAEDSTSDDEGDAVEEAS